MGSVGNAVKRNPRLLPDVIDEFSVSDPSGTYAFIPKSNDLSEGFNEVTYKQLADAVNRTCWWMDDVLKGIKVFSYSGLNDLRYPLLIAAACKTGRTILLPGQSLTLANVSAYLATHDVKHMLAADMSPTLERDSKLDDVAIVMIPEKGYFFDNSDNRHYKYDKTWEENSHEVYLVTHTSGTTGPPKPISYSHAAMGTFDIDDRTRQQYPDEKFLGTVLEKERVLSPFSLAHAGGNFMNFMRALYGNYKPVLGLPSGRPTTQTVHEAIDRAGVTCAMLPPYLLEEILLDPVSLSDIVKLKIVITTTVPLNKVTGDRLAKAGVNLQSLYGLSEAGSPLSALQFRPEEWDYIHFHRDSGFEMVYRGQNLYEAVILRDDTLSWSQMVFHVFPTAHVFYTKDLFMPHPTREGLWKFAGRRDESIALGGYPSVHLRVTPFEWMIQEHRMVKDTIIGGAGREKPFLLVERTAEAKRVGVQEAREVIFEESIKKTNVEIEEAGTRIEKENIIVVPEGKAFVRTTKGSVDRRRTIESFEEEIEALYS